MKVGNIYFFRRNTFKRIFDWKKPLLHYFFHSYPATEFISFCTTIESAQMELQIYGGRVCTIQFLCVLSHKNHLIWFNTPTVFCIQDSFKLKMGEQLSFHAAHCKIMDLKITLPSDVLSNGFQRHCYFSKLIKLST